MLTTAAYHGDLSLAEAWLLLHVADSTFGQAAVADSRTRRSGGIGTVFSRATQLMTARSSNALQGTSRPDRLDVSRSSLGLTVEAEHRRKMFEEQRSPRTNERSRGIAERAGTDFLVRRRPPQRPGSEVTNWSGRTRSRGTGTNLM